MIWWMNRLNRCETATEYECVMAWWEAGEAFWTAKLHSIFYP